MTPGEPGSPEDSPGAGGSPDDQTQRDLDALIDYALPFAHTQLASKRKLAPFAAAIGADGVVVPVTVPWSPEYNNAQRWVADLMTAIRADPELRAGAVGCDAVLADEHTEGRAGGRSGGRTDAILVVVEHRDGISLTAQHPYRLRALSRLRLMQLQVTATHPQIWPRTPAD